MGVRNILTLGIEDWLQSSLDILGLRYACIGRFGRLT